MNRFLRGLPVVALVLGLVGPISMGTVFAQTPATPAPAADTTHGNVQGTVKDNTGAPIAGVKVTLTGVQTKSTTTDSTGSFSVSGLAAGLYTVTASKAGYDTAVDADFPVFVGQTQTVAITINAITFSSLRTIASVRAVGRGTFNTTTASSQIVTAADYENQAATQVQRVLDQTPGIVIDHPGTSADNASPGAITFPSIRGGLGFETASFIDGHPLSVGKYGDYVTTFLNPYVLQSSEIIKGPGAMPPELAYAIGGTANFRTKDPTRKPTGNVVLGFSNTQGSFGNFGYSGTTPNGKFGWVLDYAVNSYYGPLSYQQEYWNLPSSAIIGGKPIGFTTNAPADPAVANNPFAYSSTLEACCFPVSQVFVNKTELVKFRYNFSPVTSFTTSYLGSQTWTDQNGNHVMGINQLFAPCGLTGTNKTAPASCPGYTGTALQNGQKVFTWQNIFPPAGEWEVNNEPIFQGELRTLAGSDTILARYYTASINRLQYNAIDNASQSFTGTYELWGCTGSGGCTKATNPQYTGQATTVTFPGSNYFRDSEEDRLNGLTLEYNHPFGDNLVTASFDTVYSATKAYTYSPGLSVSVPDGAHQRFNTLLLKGQFFVTPKLQFFMGNYFENYAQHFSPDAGVTWKDQNITRYDPRIAFEWRPNSRMAYRISAGSAIAPPYAALLNTPTAFASFRTGSLFETGTLNNPNLQPETATSYDVGADFRVLDNQTFLTFDGYLTNLRGQFLTGTFIDPNCPFYNTTSKACATTASASTVPMFWSQPQNIGTSRYAGVELALRRLPLTGWGYKAQAALVRAYPYGLGPCFYGVPAANGTVNCTVAGANLGIINNQNFQGSGTSGSNPLAGVSGSGFFSISNHAIPYAQAYLELSHRWANGMYASFGEQLYGHNNSLNVPAFWVANGTFRLPISKNVDAGNVQFSVDNVFNTYGNEYITQAAGVPATLVNGQIGLTNANVIGPRNFRLVFTRNITGGP